VTLPLLDGGTILVTFNEKPAATTRKLGRKEASHEALTLRQCLEQVAQLGSEYVVTTPGSAWSAAELLAWLHQHTPTSLGMPMYLRLPSPWLDGAICELLPQGGVVLLYRICQRRAYEAAQASSTA